MNAATCNEICIPARNYALAATLGSGQAFRWTPCDDAWEGVVGPRWVWLRQEPGRIRARTAVPVTDWRWLTHYLQTDAPYGAILRSFPRDAPMRASVAACRGLRLLRQDPWECLASFIASSTKQIVQIRQIVASLCARYGAPIPTPPGHQPAFAFPPPQRLAQTTEADLRRCQLGFRAPYLLAAARTVDNGALDLAALPALPLAEARARLLRLPGVGDKIADCVLLFACGFAGAFPVDVWVRRALARLYFRGRLPARARLARFIATHFGPQAGYAQQYLFVYMRQHRRPGSSRAGRPVQTR
ncbi:MAG: hypothetical protein JXQ71_07810 [Verrucomicrobia bacterium]|nr:hypothetical protein [Verrucomicrobiota bacterium]